MLIKILCGDTCGGRRGKEWARPREGEGLEEEGGLGNGMDGGREARGPVAGREGDGRAAQLQHPSPVTYRWWLWRPSPLWALGLTRTGRVVACMTCTGPPDNEQDARRRARP